MVIDFRAIIHPSLLPSFHSYSRSSCYWRLKQPLLTCTLWMEEPRRVPFLTSVEESSQSVPHQPRTLAMYVTYQAGASMSHALVFCPKRFSSKPKGRSSGPEDDQSCGNPSFSDGLDHCVHYGLITGHSSRRYSAKPSPRVMSNLSEGLDMRGRLGKRNGAHNITLWWTGGRSDVGQ